MPMRRVCISTSTPLLLSRLQKKKNTLTNLPFESHIRPPHVYFSVAQFVSKHIRDFIDLGLERWISDMRITSNYLREISDMYKQERMG
jgi:hypothetical protein